MANNQSIQILRGNNATIANAAKNNVELLDGQLLYNTDTNQLSIGGGGNNAIDKSPISVKELRNDPHGYITVGNSTLDIHSGGNISITANKALSGKLIEVNCGDLSINSFEVGINTHSNSPLVFNGKYNANYYTTYYYPNGKVRLADSEGCIYREGNILLASTGNGRAGNIYSYNTLGNGARNYYIESKYNNTIPDFQTSLTYNRPSSYLGCSDNLPIGLTNGSAFCNLNMGNSYVSLFQDLRFNISGNVINYDTQFCTEVILPLRERVGGSAITLGCGYRTFCAKAIVKPTSASKFTEVYIFGNARCTFLGASGSLSIEEVSVYTNPVGCTANPPSTVISPKIVFSNIHFT